VHPVYSSWSIVSMGKMMDCCGVAIFENMVAGF
jgi:hypothetical protein